MANKSKVRIVRHIDGEEYIFNCPNCNNQISCGSWETKIICKNCNKQIIIVNDVHAEVDTERTNNGS